jgi:hypothetical protein
MAVLSLSLAGQEKSFTAGGFVRGGAYFSTGDYKHDINAAFGDMALTMTATDNLNFRASVTCAYVQDSSSGRTSTHLLYAKHGACTTTAL